MADKTSDALEFDHDNPLPYGGITDIHGNIIKVITKEEHDEMLGDANRFHFFICPICVLVLRPLAFQT